MNRTDILSQQQLRDCLRQHQKRLAVGDKLPTMSDIARQSGLHRDTIYALLNGDHVEHQTQVRLSLVVKNMQIELAGVAKTKLLSIDLRGSKPRLIIGMCTALH